MIGRTLLNYEILEKLGEGGMGSVWKARDQRLNRLVAIKVLPPDKVCDAGRKQRFVQEAQAASALNHPNIVVIHDIACADGIDFIVMEYVAGSTLDRRIGRHGMRLNELLDLAIQIADALAAAHGSGIIHRDLKPGNIMVTSEGRVKLLDFGLAKLAGPAVDIGEEEMTRTLKPKTAEGVIMGTVAYMSPEQAEGKTVDARSDIFSFGAVLYEMATGERAFRGGSKLEMLSAVLKENPKPANEVVHDLPRDLEKIISRSLRKDPSRRFQNAADLKVQLADVKEESESLEMEIPKARPGRRPSMAVLALVGIAVIGTAIGGYFLRFRGQQPNSASKVLPLTSEGDVRIGSFSPDGTQIAFERKSDIYVKLVEGGTPLKITTKPSIDPRWSPDGKWIGFLRRDGVWLVPPIGGPERKVAEGRFESLGWMPDSQSLAVSEADGNEAHISGVSIVTGEKRQLIKRPAGASDFHPIVSPDGRRIAFVRYQGRYDLYVAQASGGDAQRLTHDSRFVWGAAWLDNQEIIFGSPRGGERALWRIIADGKSEPRLVGGVQGEAINPTISRPPNRPVRLAYTRLSTDFNIWQANVEISPSGDAVAIKSPAAVIASTRDEYSAQFSPDKKRIAFESNRSGFREVWVASSDGSSQLQLTSFKASYSGSPRWSPNGQSIVFESFVTGNGDIYIVNADGGAPKRLTSEPSAEARPSWSQDGKWIYFRSDRSGAENIWKTPAREPYGPAVPVTRNGAWDAMESADGKLLYFTKNAGSLWSIPTSGGEESMVLKRVRPEYWGAAEAGIYFVDGSQPKIQFFSFATQRVTSIGTIEKRVYTPAPGFSVTRDGRMVAWNQADHDQSDLMLLDNLQ